MKHHFTNLDNFRDLGGISVGGGKKIAPMRLLRSGELSKLTEGDIRLLQVEYYIRNIVDLRTKNERLESPDRMIPNTRYYALDFFPNASGEKSTGSEEQLKHMQNAAQIHRNMEELYVSYITDINVRKKLNEFLQVLLHTEKGATLFHCYAGKDRTGITAAVILTVLGASKSAVFEDYLKTNVLRQNVNRKIVDSLKESGQPQAMQEAVLAALCVEQRYLELSYETADKGYGSFEKYITEGIGLKEREWAELRNMYLI